MPRRKEDWICDTCRKPDCKGGCYYTPGRIKVQLAAMPYQAQQLTNPNAYRRSGKVKGNPMEGQWAIRADLHRALEYVEAGIPNGPTVRQVVELAYVGVPMAGRSGDYSGCSDNSIARLLHLDDRTVAAYRRRGLRLMVEKLNPDYKFEEE